MDKRSRISKKPNRAQRAILITIVCFGLLFDIFVLYIVIFPDNSKEINNSLNLLMYQETAVYYQSFPEIKEIAEKCRYEYNKTSCIFEELPFEYNYYRKNSPIFLSPTQYMELDGLSVCRDVAVIRKAILNEIGIDSMYIFEPNHVYIVAAEHNMLYELNNQFMTEENGGYKVIYEI